MAQETEDSSNKYSQIIVNAEEKPTLCAKKEIPWGKRDFDHFELKSWPHSEASPLKFLTIIWIWL